MKANELKPMTFRIKPSVAETIRDIAYQNGLTQGALIENMLNLYIEHTKPNDNTFHIGSINKLDPKDSKPFKKVHFLGKTIFTSDTLYLKPASTYSELLFKTFSLKNIIFSKYVVGSKISIAEVDDGSGGVKLILHETLIFKKQGDEDFSLYAQWVKYVDTIDDLMKSLSPFVSQSDIIKISSLYADNIDINEAEKFAPNFN